MKIKQLNWVHPLLFNLTLSHHNHTITYFSEMWCLLSNFGGWSNIAVESEIKPYLFASFLSIPQYLYFWCVVATQVIFMRKDVKRESWRVMIFNTGKVGTV